MTAHVTSDSLFSKKFPCNTFFLKKVHCHKRQAKKTSYLRGNAGNWLLDTVPVGEQYTAFFANTKHTRSKYEHHS